MKKPSLRRLSAGVLSLAAVGIVAAPLCASAAPASSNQTVNAVIASTISMTTNASVSMNVTPTAAGSQSSASDSVKVSTNNVNGYNLTLVNADTDTNLVDPLHTSNTIGAHTGTLSSPTQLATNSWGYAVSGGNFSGSYSAIDNEANNTTKWAGVPQTTADQITSTSGPGTDNETVVWYSAKANTSKPSGTYTDTVTYTATVNP